MEYHVSLDVARAAVVHDFLYWNCAKAYPELTKDGEDEIGVMTWQDVRKAADKIFRLAMRCSDPPVPKWKIGVAYRAVRLFGSKPARTIDVSEKPKEEKKRNTKNIRGKMRRA